jgi:AAHS family 3-hydroxyphenylpropionic acid transporter
VLVAAVLLFGVFTLATMVAPTYETLFAVRLGCGLGFGMALPNIMAMASEVASREKRGSTASMMFCGMPVGGGTVALISWLTPAQDWRTLFLIGGLTPVILAPALMLLLRDSRSEAAKAEAAADRQSIPLWHWLGAVPVFLLAWLGFKALAAEPGLKSITGVAPWLALLVTVVLGYVFIHRRALLGGGRTATSVMLWVVFVPTLLILYLILNWLPTLVAAKGFPKDASQASVWFNWGSVAGALFMGWLVDRLGIRWVLSAGFAGLVAALLALSAAADKSAIMILSGAVGFCLLGANYALYGAAASYYPEAIRGRGSGAAVAWGRFGAVAGPLTGGYLLAAGRGPGEVVFAMIPFAVIAGVGVLALSFIGKPAD